MPQQARVGRMLRGVALALLALPAASCVPGARTTRHVTSGGPVDLTPMPDLSDEEYRRTRTTGEEFLEDEQLARRLVPGCSRG